MLLGLSLRAFAIRMRETLEVDDADWDSYADNVDNGIEAILAVKDCVLPNGEGAFDKLRGLAETAVPFIPPPYGMAVGGILSLMSGIFGWDAEDEDPLAELAQKMESGFAKLAQKMESIIAKLDRMSLAIQTVLHNTQ